MDDPEPPSDINNLKEISEKINYKNLKLSNCPFFYSLYCEGKNPESRKYKDVTCFTDSNKHLGCDVFPLVLKDYLDNPDKYKNQDFSGQEKEFFDQIKKALKLIESQKKSQEPVIQKLETITVS